MKTPTAIAGRDQLNSAKFGSIQFSSTQQNSAQLSLTQFCTTKINSAQFSTIQLNSAQFGSIQFSSTQFSSTQLNSAQPFLCNTAGSQLTTGRSVMFLFTKFFEHVSHFFSNFTQSKVKAIDG